MTWLEEKKASVNHKITPIKFSEMSNWGFNAETGNLEHDSGKFFSIEGINVRTNWGKVPEWSQPIINQPEIGFLGIITKMIDDVVLRMNRSAAQAAKQATPIFVNAIKSMSIQDAFGILNGADNSATLYFKEKTYSQLQNSFKPKIRTSLNKPIISGISANKAWNTLTNGYNKVVNLVPGWKTVNTNLDDYVTKKALDGLFLKVAFEEKKIRSNPSARINNILKRVFGDKLY
jgi:hypothetical protein